jgi:probable HAF family extracellular repeat protein
MLLLAGCDRAAGPTASAGVNPPPGHVAPTVTLDGPAPGTRTRVPSVAVAGSAQDMARVTRVAYTVNSEAKGAERALEIEPGKEVRFAFTVPDLPVGSDTIRVYAYDPRGNRGSASVVVVFQPNRPPVAADDTASTRSDSSVTVAVLRNDTDADGDTLRLESVAQPASGSARANPDGTVTFVPGGAGTVSFRYVVTDGYGGADTAGVTVAVRPVPAPGSWRVTVLPQLSAAFVDMNDRGEVLALLQESFGNGYKVSLLWTGGSQYQSLGYIPFGGTGASIGARALTHALNDAGQHLYSVCTAVTGFNFKTCTQYGFSAAGTVLEGAGSLVPESTSARLNDAGLAIVNGSVWQGGARVQLPAATTGTPRAAVLYRNGAATLLAVGDSADATDVNEAGQVVGVAWEGTERYAFLWENGSARRLPGPVATFTGHRRPAGGLPLEVRNRDPAEQPPGGPGLGGDLAPLRQRRGTGVRHGEAEEHGSRRRAPADAGSVDGIHSTPNEEAA